VDAPIFVVGNDRSGTTMLRLILDRSAELAIPPESMFLVDFAPIRRRGGLGDPAAARRFLARVWSHPKVRRWRLPSGPPELPEGLDHEQAYRFCVESPFRAYAEAQGKPRWGDKTPWYVHHVEELLAVWPEARFVVLVRDGRDVALSVGRMPWGPNNAWSAARWWAAGIRAGAEAMRRHPEQVMQVRYEDLASDPAPLAQRIAAFCGLSYQADMLAIERSQEAKVLEDQRAWFTNIWAGINTAPVGKWRTQMDGRSQRVFLSLAGRELEELGYPSGQVPPVGRYRQAWYALHDSALRLVNVVRLRLIRERGRELGYAVRRKLVRA
jgi:hypothetical protein